LAIEPTHTAGMDEGADCATLVTSAPFCSTEGEWSDLATIFSEVTFVASAPSSIC